MKRFTHAKQYEATIFNWKGTKGSADASELGLKPGEVLHYTVYNDSCDEGFTLISSKTRREVDFIHTRTDSSGWYYESTCKKFHLTVWND